MKTFAPAILIASLVYSPVLYAQNVGIGTTTPIRGTLEVAGAVGSTVAIFGGDGQGISVQRSNPGIGFNHYLDGLYNRYMANGYAALQRYNASTGDMYYDLFGSGTVDAQVSGGLTAMTISKTGNAGIGTPPLSYARLAVARGTGGDGTAIFRGSVYQSHINYSTAENTYIRGGKAGSYVYLNDLGGGDVIFGNPTATLTSMVKVGINSNNPQYALEMKQVNNLGLIMIASNFANWHLKTGPALAPGSYQLLYYNESGNAIGAFHPQTGAYAALSDARVKTDILPLPAMGSQLQALKPIQYQADVPQATGKTYPGFIAEDLEKVLPALVTQDKEPVPGSTVPDMHFVNYDGMAVYAIRIIQEQQKKIDELKRRINELQQKH
jgi:hypothetical protein